MPLHPHEALLRRIQNTRRNIHEAVNPKYHNDVLLRTAMAAIVDYRDAKRFELKPQLLRAAESNILDLANLISESKAY